MGLRGIVHGLVILTMQFTHRRPVGSSSQQLQSYIVLVAFVLAAIPWSLTVGLLWGKLLHATKRAAALIFVRILIRLTECGCCMLADSVECH